MELINPNTSDKRSFIPHRLHASTRSWPETNCYIDLWIEVLASLDMTAEASLGFTVSQDFGSDQFNFSKIPLQDLELLYGLNVREISIYQTLEQHTALHVGNGSIVLLEADAYYLPDTAGITYRQYHGKTTIAVDVMYKDIQQCSYFHNATRAKLLDRDYCGIFKLLPHLQIEHEILSPYVEVVEKSTHWHSDKNLKTTAFDLLRAHFNRRPTRNPFTAWRDVFKEHVQNLLLKPDSYHDYAFHFPRLVGSNFELLGSHLEWISPGALHDTAIRFYRIAETAKVIQFRLARSIARGREDLLPECFDCLEHDYMKAMQELGQYVS